MSMTMRSGRSLSLACSQKLSFPSKIVAARLAHSNTPAFEMTKAGRECIEKKLKIKLWDVVIHLFSQRGTFVFHRMSNDVVIPSGMMATHFLCQMT
jgi:hypothetical protein